MANGDGTGTEVVIRESVSKVMAVISSSLDDLGKQAVEFNKTVDQGLSQVEEHILKVTSHVRNLSTSFNTATSSANAFARALGAAGLTGSMVLLGRSLEHLASSTINLKYTSEEMGLSTQAFLRLQQAYMRLGYSSGEASSRIAATAHVMRDMGARGFASPYAQQLLQMGEGGSQLARTLIQINRTSGSTEEEFTRLSEVFARATPAQRMYLAQFLQAPERLYALNDAMKQNTTEVEADDKQMEKYNNAMVTLRTTLNNVGTTISGTVIEKLNELMKKLQDLGIFQQLKEWIAAIDTDKLAKTISNIGTSIANLLEMLREVSKWGEKADEKDKKKGDEEETDLRPEGWKSSGTEAQAIEGGPLGFIKRMMSDQTIMLPQARPLDDRRQELELEKDTNRILQGISDALTGTGGAGTAPGSSPPGTPGTPGSGSPGPSFDDSKETAPGAISQKRAEAYKHIRDLAAAAGSPDPDYTASLAMHESGWLANAGVYARSRYTNPFGQTAVGGGNASYKSLEEGIQAHLKQWGSLYGATAEETTANLRARGYNSVSPEWGGAIRGIYHRMRRQQQQKQSSVMPGGSVWEKGATPFYNPSVIDGVLAAAGGKQLGDATVTVDVASVDKDAAQRKDIFIPIRGGVSPPMPIPGAYDVNKTRLASLGQN